MTNETLVVVVLVELAAIATPIVLAVCFKKSLIRHIAPPALIALVFAAYCLLHIDAKSSEGNWALFGALWYWVFAALPVLTSSIAVPLILKTENRWIYSAILVGLWILSGAVLGVAGYLGQSS